MNKLVKGIQRFQSQVFTQQEEMFRELSKGQSPPALVITCSDSRICPNLLTQSKPGELFALRTAGNIVPAYGDVLAGEAATVEYAVAALNVEDVIICGHSHCGAVNALMNPGSVDNLPSVKNYLCHASETLRVMQEEFADITDPVLRLKKAIEQNVLVQIENLKTHPAVQTAIRKRGLRIHGWVYTIESGEISMYNEAMDEFQAIRESRQMNVATA